MGSKKERARLRIGKKEEESERESLWLFLLPSLLSFLSLHPIFQFHHCLPGSSGPSCSLPNLYTKPPCFPPLSTRSLTFSFSAFLLSQKENKGSKEVDENEEDVGEAELIFLSCTTGFWEDKREAKVPRNQELIESQRTRACSYTFMSSAWCQTWNEWTHFGQALFNKQLVSYSDQGSGCKMKSGLRLCTLKKCVCLPS